MTESKRSAAIRGHGVRVRFSVLRSWAEALIGVAQAAGVVEAVVLFAV